MKLHDPEIASELDAVAYIDELTQALEERDRARALAARLEEIVAMRTKALRAIVEWYREDGDSTRTRLEALIAWAEAQLSEVP